MQYQPNVNIEMTNYQYNTAPLFAKPAAKIEVDEDEDEDEEPAISRVTGSIIWFWAVVVCTTSIPFINLFLFFFQPFELARGINKQNLNVQNLGRLQDFTFFYLVMGLYTIITVVFTVYSCQFASLWQRFKLFVMVDNIMICMLATDVAYAALHVVSFTTVYSSDEEYNLTPEFIIFWQDYVVIALYCMTNLAYIGIFRVLMVSIYWKSWQTIVYKLGIILSSLSYIAIGLLYIFGSDTLSQQVDGFNSEIDPVIDYCYTDPQYFGSIPFLQREENSLASAQAKISGFILLYVFTNFAFSFEVVAKLTDFDGTADLKTGYKLQDQDEE